MRFPLVIQATNLTKTFVTTEKQSGLVGSLRSLLHPTRREIHAVKGITLDVQEGERLAFIGPNGAGESTTIKMLTGILYPTSGQAREKTWWEGSSLVRPPSLLTIEHPTPLGVQTTPLPGRPAR